MPYFLYILECQNGSLYTGYTVDMERRWEEHRLGLPKCKYTRSFPPKKIAVYWALDCDLSTILKLEHWVKRCSRSKKLELIQDPHLLERLYANPR